MEKLIEILDIDLSKPVDYIKIFVAFIIMGFIVSMIKNFAGI